ncbi:MAG: ankyrin repeat domain-containing protein [Chloroflexia bacterium]
MDTTTGLSPEVIEEFVIACHGNYPKIRAMLEQEPGLLNEKWTKFDENGLEASGHMGRADIANHLLEKGAPLTIFAAAMLGRTEDVAAFLSEDPARATAPGVHGISILYHAALSGKVEIAEMLVAHGGGDEAGHALHAAVRPGHVEMVEWLLARGGDPNTLNFEGKTTLDVALAQGHEAVADKLRAHGGVESPIQEERGA